VSSATADSGGGSLNSYGVIPYAFNDTAQEIWTRLGRARLCGGSGGR
jgi:hypothetical protein